MTITPIPEPRAVEGIREQITTALAARRPAELELVYPAPGFGSDEVCAYCGAFESDEDAERRTREHVLHDLLAVHRAAEELAREFRVASPGRDDDVYDLLCELDQIDRADRAWGEAA
ncbi:hypothetical protein [Brachybacterium kimchii]|uniref:Uncharacterized protein n=1 Tax=Brachybacterium kimchii TaxID=2942909 RepID=A0ABY4N822_9MICO|nr:hypothetical protein [Brachybacterium kimchii]UQN30692.1 hypothetical protein M4486_05150 [Brachybacterium kimchii]